MRIKKLISELLSIPKTIIFNFVVFPINIAIKFPVYISYDVQLEYYYRGCMLINGKISRFMIRFNLAEGSVGVNNNLSKKGFLKISKNSKLIFNGKAEFSKGISIRSESGNLIFGRNFSCNNNCFISCSKGISFGDNVLVGWSVNIRDSDGHKVYNKNSKKVDQSMKEVSIGKNVWIAAYVDILKGTRIKDNSVIGYRSCVTRKFDEGNCVIAGLPAKIIKSNIEWEK